METKVLKTERDIIIGTELSSDFRTSVSTEAQCTIDAYSRYFAEKDASEKYRLTITVNPLCSNVLFNAATEIVFNEGTDDCSFIEDSPKGGTIPSSVTVYNTSLNRQFNRDIAIQDTAYSHEKIGNASYHCGYDIFNNHMLRRIDFSIINKNNSTGNKANFNTLSDYLRNGEGDIIESEIPKISGSTLETGTTKLHVYDYDSIRTFQESIEDNLIELDGWFGFRNPSNLPIENYSGISINRCINNRPAGSFIDMYPGRSEYTFIPKYNSSRKRYEKNWDYCITYPYTSVTDNQLVTEPISLVNGLECEITNESGETLMWTGYTSEQEVVLCTKIKHNLSVGDTIRLIFISGTTSEESDTITVTGTGYLGENFENYFSVRLSDITSFISRNIDSEGKITLGIRVRKVVNGVDCKYYLRKFRRLPNFKFSNVYEDGIITEDEIINNKKDFANFVKKMAFSKNIYSDDIAQIVFTDDINTNGIKNNLGLPLTEIFLTIVKANKGHKEWYEDKKPNHKNVEISHCFGNVSSGFDIFSGDKTETIPYNIHTIYNSGSTEELESGITIDNADFYGDIVEFYPALVFENELEPVYHRFNTVQRENSVTITYQDLVNDDYGINSGFEYETRQISGITFNEGYYYQTHYRIPLKELSGTVKQGSHIRMIINDSGKTGDEYSVTGVTVYHLSEGEKIRLYKINGDSEAIEGTITEASPFSLAFKFTTEENISDLTDYFLFKLNQNKPSYAIELNDGSGRYLWRDIESFSKLGIDNELYDSIFTNGAHYRYLNLNFYLRRQDPFNEYGLWPKVSEEYLLTRGKDEDISNVEYVKEEISVTC